MRTRASMPPTIVTHDATPFHALSPAAAAEIRKPPLPIGTKLLSPRNFPAPYFTNQPYLLVGPAERIRRTLAAAGLVLIRSNGAVRIAGVVLGHQRVGRPGLGHDVPHREAQEPTAELGVLHAVRLHVGLDESTTRGTANHAAGFIFVLSFYTHTMVLGAPPSHLLADSLNSFSTTQPTADASPGRRTPCQLHAAPPFKHFVQHPTETAYTFLTRTQPSCNTVHPVGVSPQRPLTEQLNAPPSMPCVPCKTCACCVRLEHGGDATTTCGGGVSERLKTYTEYKVFRDRATPQPSTPNLTQRHLRASHTVDSVRKKCFCLSGGNKRFEVLANPKHCTSYGRVRRYEGRVLSKRISTIRAQAGNGRGIRIRMIVARCSLRDFRDGTATHSRLTWGERS